MGTARLHFHFAFDCFMSDSAAGPTCAAKTALAEALLLDHDDADLFAAASATSAGTGGARSAALRATAPGLPAQPDVQLQLAGLLVDPGRMRASVRRGPLLPPAGRVAPTVV
jgi:hypothetical protein